MLLLIFFGEMSKYSYSLSIKVSLYFPYFFILVILTSWVSEISFFILDKSVSEEITNLHTSIVFSSKYFFISSIIVILRELS